MNPNLLISKWPRLSERQIRAGQAAQLRRYLRDVVVPHSPHYREVFRRERLDADDIGSLDDLRRLPFTSKADLLNTPEHPQKAREFILQPDPRELARRPVTILRAALTGRANVKRGFEREFRPIFMTCTTGRSTESVAFLYTQHDLDSLARRGSRIFEICKSRPDFRLLNTFPYAPHLAFWLTHYGGMAFNNLVVSSGGGKVFGTEGQIRLIRQLQPHVIIGMPTFVYHTLRQAVDEGVRCPDLQLLVVGGEKAAPGVKQRLAQLARELGAKQIEIVATYGFTEAKMAWTECPGASGETSGFHLYPDHGIIEVIDPRTGEPVPEGHPGEIVFTPLDARGSVVLRYRTGDRIDGGLTYEPCPHCHRSLPRLFGEISRSSEIKTMRLDKLKGTLVDFNVLEHALDDAAHLDLWQLELCKRNNDPLDLDELVLHVHKTDSLEDAKCAQELRRCFADKTEIQPNRIVFHDRAEMSSLLGIGTQLKEQKIADHRPAGKGAPPHANGKAHGS